MPNAITLRDWTYVAVIIALAVTYAAGLLSQATSAHAANDKTPSVCVYSGAAT
jgi:hypothetical protein